MSRLARIGEDRFRYEKIIATDTRMGYDVISPQPFAKEPELLGKMLVGLEKKRIKLETQLRRLKPAKI